MANPEEITEAIKKLSEISKIVADYTAQENFSVRSIRDDVTFLNNRKEQLILTLAEMDKRIEDARKEADVIISAARKEADNLIHIARENLAFAARDREAAKQELESAKQMHYLAEKQLDVVTA